VINPYEPNIDRIDDEEQMRRNREAQLREEQERLRRQEEERVRREDERTRQCFHP
jgi:hypothetical protein